MADQMRGLLKPTTANITNQGLVIRHMSADVREQESTLAGVGVGAVGPLAATIDEGARDVLVGQVQLLIC